MEGGRSGGCFNTTKAIRWWSGMRNALLPSPGLPPSRGWALLMSLDDFKKYHHHLYIPHVSVNHTHPLMSLMSSCYQLWITTHLIAGNDPYITKSYVTLQVKSSLILKRNETAFTESLTYIFRNPHVSVNHTHTLMSLMSPCYQLWIITHLRPPLSKKSFPVGRVG